MYYNNEDLVYDKLKIDYLVRSMYYKLAIAANWKIYMSFMSICRNPF
jgi:hypothetical protein